MSLGGLMGRIASLGVDAIGEEKVGMERSELSCLTTRQFF